MADDWRRGGIVQHAGALSRVVEDSLECSDFKLTIRRCLSMVKGLSLVGYVDAAFANVDIMQAIVIWAPSFVSLSSIIRMVSANLEMPMPWEALSTGEPITSSRFGDVALEFVEAALDARERCDERVPDARGPRRRPLPKARGEEPGLQPGGVGGRVMKITSPPDILSNDA